MKHLGCTSYYRDDLCEDLLKVFDRVLKTAPAECSKREVCRLVANEPAPRYYVTSRRAIEVVGRIYRSRKPKKKQLNMREKMYEDIYKKTVHMMERTGLGLEECVERVIERPAPSFYVTGGTVRNIISQVMREKRRRRHG